MMNNQGFYYLASPYSHPDKEVRHFRYELTEEALAWLLEQKLWTYSPIVHCHNMARRLAMPTDAAFWQDYNHTMMRSAQEILVLKIDGWDVSVGVTEELQYANNNGLAVGAVIPWGPTYRIEMAT